MAIAHSATIRNQIATLIRDAIDAGSGAGKLVLLDAADAIIAEIPLNDPCGTVSGNVLSFDLSPSPEDPSANATGAIVTFEIRDSNDNMVLSGAVSSTGGGGDLTMPNISVTAGEIIRISTLVYTASVF